MRNCHRNNRSFWYANPVAVEKILDENGFDTLEVETIYEDPHPYVGNIAANTGGDFVQKYGEITDYQYTMTITALECPFVEGCKIWFKNDPGEENDCMVDRILDSKNCFLIGIREVAKDETY